MILTDDFELGLSIYESDERLRPNYSIVMAKLEGKVGKHLKDLASLIPDHHLVGIGREPDPHITVLYGLHDHHPKGAQDVLAGFHAPQVRFGRVSHFSNPKFDVLKIDVHSPDLDDMHQALRKLPNTQKFDYKPHTTVAYVKRGLGSHYADELNKVSQFDGHVHQFDTVHFSEPRARQQHAIEFKNSPRPRVRSASRSVYSPDVRPMPGKPVEQVIAQILAGGHVDEMLTAAMVGTQPVSAMGLVRPIYPSRRRNVRRTARV